MEHNQIRRTVQTKQRRKARCDEWVAYSTHSWRVPIVEYKTNLGIEFGSNRREPLTADKVLFGFYLVDNWKKL